MSDTVRLLGFRFKVLPSSRHTLWMELLVTTFIITLLVLVVANYHAAPLKELSRLWLLYPATLWPLLLQQFGFLMLLTLALLFLKQAHLPILGVPAFFYMAIAITLLPEVSDTEKWLLMEVLALALMLSIYASARFSDLFSHSPLLLSLLSFTLLVQGGKELLIAPDLWQWEALIPFPVPLPLSMLLAIVIGALFALWVVSPLGIRLNLQSRSEALFIYSGTNLLLLLLPCFFSAQIAVTAGNMIAQSGAFGLLWLPCWALLLVFLVDRQWITLWILSFLLTWLQMGYAHLKASWHMPMAVEGVLLTSILLIYLMVRAAFRYRFYRPVYPRLH